MPPKLVEELVAKSAERRVRLAGLERLALRSLAGSHRVMADEETSRIQLELAFHEAGHAVVLWSFGLRVDLVTIEAKRHGSDYEGVVKHEEVDVSTASDDTRIKVIAVALAGREAERIALRTLGGDRWRNSVLPRDDLLGAEKAASYFEDPNAARKSGADLAERTLRANWALVVAVAARLQAARDLDAAAFLEIVTGPVLAADRIVEIVEGLRTQADRNLRAAGARLLASLTRESEDE